MKELMPKRMGTMQATLFKNYVISIILTMIIGAGLIGYLGSIMQNVSSGQKDISMTLRIEFIAGILGAVFLFLLVLITFSKWTSRKIIEPLNNIVSGLDKMTQGDYNTRMEFNAENEFAGIKDSFNFMAEKLERTIGEKDRLEDLRRQLLVDISHDLKTPVTSIQGYSKALYDGVVKDEENRQKYLKIIYEKSERVASLADNLHELTKLDSSGYRLNTKNEDFAEFLREMVAEFYNDIENKNFELVVNIPEKEMFLEFDRKEMARALYNIITNALKYNPEGTRLRIELYEKIDADGLMLEIGDNGIGIPNDLKNILFDPFTRGDAARQSTGGTGLGLSISKRIIEKHGGSINLKESSTENTIFVIEL